MSFTAKSVIIDCADNYGRAYMGLRSVEFVLNGSIIPLTSGFTAYATSYYGAAYLPGNAFNTSLSKTGTIDNTTWLSANGSAANQRIIVVFDSPLTFDGIVINNAHHEGGWTDAGVAGFTVTLSDDEITNTVYRGVVTSIVAGAVGVLTEHVASDIEDPQEIGSFYEKKSASAFYSDNNYGAPANLEDEDISTYVQGFTYCCGDFGEAFKLGVLRIAVHNSAAYTYQSTTGVKLQGSNDTTNGSDGTWDDILTFNSGNLMAPAAYPGFCGDIQVDAGTAYRYYRLTGMSSTSQVINEWVVFGVIEIASNYLRTVLDQKYNLERDYMRVLINQDYALLARMINGLDQLYSFRQLAKLDQLYWNMPQYRQGLTQRYGDCVFMRRLLHQDYGELYRYRTDLEQLYTFPEGLRQLMVQKYGIAEEQLRGHCDQVYELSEHERHRAQLQQLWVLISAGSVVLNYDVQVQAFNGPDVLALDAVSAIVTELHPYNINQELDEELYHMSGELQLARQSEFKVCRHLKTIVQIRVGTRVARYVVEDPRREKGSNGEVIYVVPLASPTLLLGHSDSPYSAIEDQPLVGMGRDLIEMLASPVAVVEWRMVNRYIPSPVWRTNGKRRIELIKDLVHAWGGIVQTLPDNTLVCRPRYPVDVNLWRTAAPQVQLSDQADFFSLTPSVDPRDGYNSFYLADSDISGDGVTIMEEEIDAYTKKVKVYLQPWDEDEVVILHHSGGSWVTIIFHGVKNGLEENQIEIVGGSGQVDLPVHELQGVDWRQNDLGEITAAEDGTLTTEIDGNSLALVSWSTRYHEFTVIDPKAEDVQIWAEVV